MARKRFPARLTFLPVTGRKVWVARWWEDVIQADGTLGRLRRSQVIGTVELFCAVDVVEKIVEGMRIEPTRICYSRRQEDCGLSYVSFSSHHPAQQRRLPTLSSVSASLIGHPSKSW
jgi:hypothetical protein